MLLRAIPHPRKMFGVGLNYRSTASAMLAPAYPVLHHPAVPRSVDQRERRHATSLGQQSRGGRKPDSPVAGVPDDTIVPAEDD